MFTCSRCGRSSSHPQDVREGYCGACHDFTGQHPAPYLASVSRRIAEVIVAEQLGPLQARLEALERGEG